MVKRNWIKLAFFLMIVSMTIAACTFTKKVKTGKMAYERKQYAVAIEMLSEEFEQTNNKSIQAQIAYYLGKSYQRTNQNRKSINWFKKSYQLDFGPDALNDLAFALKEEELYNEAVAIFRQLESEGGRSNVISREISICQLAQKWKDEAVENEIQLRTLNFNTDLAEYGVTFYEDDLIVFTSDRFTNADSEEYKWTGNAYSDLYVSRKDGSKARLFDRRINSEHNDGAACFNSDFTEMYFTRCYSKGAEDSYCKLMLSFRRGKLWTDPRELDFFSEPVNFGQPAISANDSILFFSCEHPEGEGGFDLYYSLRSENGWLEPRNLSNRINTVGDEQFPTVDGDTLYFSSNGHTGMGGLDIFKTFVRPDGLWEVPENLKPPINSGSDDFGYVIDRSAPLRGNLVQTGFFSSSRKGIGNDDIYSFNKYALNAPPEDTISQPEEDPLANVKIYLAIKVIENLRSDPSNPNSTIIGKDRIKAARLEINNGEAILNENSGSLGFVVIDVDPAKNYRIMASKDNYLNGVAEFNSSEIRLNPGETEKTFNVEIVLNPIFVGTEIVLENIYYDLDKWDIRADAEPSLDELSNILKNNPDVRIQLASHTDCRGEDDYNQDLSQKRAESAVNYLIENGISPDRLTAKGYGETKFAVDCECNKCTEQEHQANRRTTFEILEY